MLAALEEFLPRETTWTTPQGGLFIWAKLPDYIDTTDLLARALREHVAFVPGRAAYLDGRGGSEMRLNFSGVGDDDIREGIRRIGKVVSEQVALYGTLTGAKPAPEARSAETGRPAAPPGGLVKVAVLKGGTSLERTVSLRSGARVEDALARLGHDVLPIDVGADLVDRLTAERPDVAFVALHGRGGEDGTVQELLELVGIPYTASRPGACIRCMDKVVAKHALRDAGIPTPDFYAFNQTAFEELGAARALPAIEERLEFPIVVKPAGQGSALGIKFARTAADVPERAGRGVLLRHEGAAGALRRRAATSPSRCSSRPDGPGGAAGGRGDPGHRGLLRLRGALRDRRARASSAPPTCSPELTLRAQELALATWRTLGCAGFARVDLMLAGDELTVLEANAIPGLTDTSLLPLAAEAAGIGFDDFVARVLDLAVARTA